MKKNILKKEQPSVAYVIYIIILLIFLISVNYFIFFKIQLLQTNNKTEEHFENYRDLISATNYIFNGQRILQNAGNNLLACDDSLNCLEFKNSTNKWSGTINYKNPVSLAEKNIIKLSLKSVDGQGAINLVGKLSDNQVSWWNGRKELNIFLNNNQLIINTITGKSQSYIEIFNGEISTDENGFFNFHILTDKWGSNVSFIDKNGQEFKNAKYNELFSDNNIGFFPDGQIYLGILTEAYSSFKIAEFFAMPAIIMPTLLKNNVGQ